MPTLGFNLINVMKLMSYGYLVLFENGECCIKDKQIEKPLVTIKMTSNQMFPLHVSQMGNFVLTAIEDDESILRHLRYGYLHLMGLRLLRDKNMVKGLPKIDDIKLCQGCVYGKQTRKSFPVGKSWRASSCLELLHADLCGTMQTTSLGGSKYFLLSTDDYTRMSWMYFLNSKDQTFEKFKSFKALVETQSDCCIKILCTDNGREFVSNKLNSFCEEYGIHRESIIPYTPE